MKPTTKPCPDMGRATSSVVPGELVHHHDAGSQDTALGFPDALMAPIIGLFSERVPAARNVPKGPLKTISDVEFSTLARVDWWNNWRLHSSIEMVPPVE